MTYIYAMVADRQAIVRPFNRLRRFIAILVMLTGVKIAAGFALVSRFIAPDYDR